VVAVDLSNLCRDQRFLRPGIRADLGLIDQFLSGLERSDIRHRAVIWVADRSLIPLLGQEERRRLRDLEVTGELEISTLADERLLELAFSEYADSGTLIATMDNFDDFRRTYPEIQGSKDRFLAWSPDDGGRLRIEFRNMGVHSHRRLSRKEESAEFKARRLLRDSIVRKATANYFRCENGGCLLAGLWPNRLPELPRYDDHSDKFVCPSCGAEVVAGASRPPAAQLIVFLDGTEQFRVLIEEDQEIAIGRIDAPGQIGLASRLPRERTDAISRSHVRMTMTDGRLRVEDLGSRNGTVVRNQGSGAEALLTPRDSRQIRRGDTIALPSGITLELTGRSIPLHDGDSSALTVEPADGDRATRILATRP